MLRLINKLILSISSALKNLSRYHDASTDWINSTYDENYDPYITNPLFVAPNTIDAGKIYIEDPMCPRYIEKFNEFKVTDIIAFQNRAKPWLGFPRVSPVTGKLTGNSTENCYFFGEEVTYGMVVRKEKDYMDVLFGDKLGRVYPQILAVLHYKKITEQEEG